MDAIELLNDLTGGQLLLWKVLLTSVIFACAGLQVLLAARFYEASTVPPISTGAASRTHRLNGKLTVTLAVVVALTCLAGPAGPTSPTRVLLHSVFGSLVFGLLAAKYTALKLRPSWGRYLPWIGSGLFLTVEPGADEPRTTRVQAVDPGFTGDKFRFDPDELTVAAGTTLLVANVGGKPHTLSADDGSFDTGIIDPGAEGGRFAGKNASVTLNQAGTFKFHCEIHPAAMKGAVTVTGQAAAGTPAQASAGPREVDVGAVDFAFQPKDASVAAGGKVTVTNRGQAPHTITLDDVQLDTGNIAPGATAELTAPDAPGSYSYRCAVHPARMRGVLVVLGRDTDDPNAQAAAPPPAQAAQSGDGGGGGPDGGVTAFVLATAVVAAFLGGIGVSAFALRRRTAT